MHVLQAVSAFEVSTQIEGMLVLQIFVEHGRIGVGEGRLGRTRWAWAVTLERMRVRRKTERSLVIGSVLDNNDTLPQDGPPRAAVPPELTWAPALWPTKAVSSWASRRFGFCVAPAFKQMRRRMPVRPF